jgi:pentatricopeptide repeat protein
MADDYRITPTLSHFTCLIDLLGRAGQLEEALAMASESPFHADIAMWLAILGACRKWGNSELARHAFEHALLCQGYQASAYICMLNVIADAG